MRERDRWWGFFRGDSEWHKIPNTDGKGKGRPYAEYDIDVSQRNEKMRGWLSNDESSTFHQLDDDDGAELTGKPNGTDNALDENAKDSKAVEGTARIETASPNDGVSRIMSNTHLPREPTPRILSLLDQVSHFISFL